MVFMLRSELNRAFRNKSLFVVVLVNTAVIAYGFLDSWSFFTQAQANPQFGYPPYYFNAFEIFLLALTLTPFIYVAVLGATVPYADSLVADRESGYMRYAIYRAGYWHYLLSKLIANWLVGALAVSLAMALAFGIAAVLFPLHLPPLYVDGVKVSIIGIPHSPRGHVFETSPGLYILGRIGLGFLFGGAYATLGFAVSCVARNRYVVLASPFLIFLVTTLLSDIFGLYGWIPPVAIVPEVNTNSSMLTMLVNYFLIYGGSLGFILVVFGRNWRVNGQRVA